MKLPNGRITILINQDGTTIEIRDNDSGTTFARIKLTPEQFSSALSRLSQTECEVEVIGLDRVGKLQEHKQHEFELTGGLTIYNRHNDLPAIIKLANATCPEGWVPDAYFGSKDSLVDRGDKTYARTMIRRWVDRPTDTPTN